MSGNKKSTTDQNLIDFSDDADQNSPATILELFDPIHETIFECPTKMDASAEVVNKSKQNQDLDNKKKLTILTPPQQPHQQPNAQISKRSSHIPEDAIVDRIPISDKAYSGEKRKSNIIVVPDMTNFELDQGKSILARKHQRSNLELVSLTNRIITFRVKFKFSDQSTNPGIIYSPTLNSPKIRDTSVKITITSSLALESTLR